MDEIEIKQKEYRDCTENVKIYKIYKMFAYDFLFWYCIEVLFLTTIKNITVAQIMFLNSIYALSSCLCQPIVGLIIKKLNNRMSIIIGNIVLSIFALTYILSSNYNMFLVAQVISAFGFGIKSVAEGNILYGSLKRINKRDRFSKIEGLSISRYYYLSALCGVIAGYLFIINGYIPVILCFITNLIGLIISISFKDYIPSSSNENDDYENNNTGFKRYIESFRKIIKSNRAKSIFVFAFMFYGVVAISLILYKSILIDFGVTAQYIAIIASAHSIVIGIGSKSLYHLEKKTKNKTLTIFGITYTIALFLIGFVGINNQLNKFNIITICICLFIMAIIQGAYRIAIKKYVVSFTTGDIRTNMISIYYMVEGIGKSILLFICGIILKYNSNARTAMIIGTIGLAMTILVLIYIDNKLGLKPEEYEPKEIFKEEKEI